MKLVELAIQNGDSFERGIQLAIQAVLVSPQFLFRVELDSRGKFARAKAGQQRGDRVDRRLRAGQPALLLFVEQYARRRALASSRGWLTPSGDTLEKQVRRMLRIPKRRPWSRTSPASGSSFAT